MSWLSRPKRLWSCRWRPLALACWRGYSGFAGDGAVADQGAGSGVDRAGEGPLADGDQAGREQVEAGEEAGEPGAMSLAAWAMTR